jgi:K+ transporter
VKNWDAGQWVKFLLGVTVFIFLNTYIIGAFILNQQTNEVNIQLRMRMIDLLGFIVAQLLVGGNKDKNKNT